MTGEVMRIEGKHGPRWMVKTPEGVWVKVRKIGRFAIALVPVPDDWKVGIEDDEESV